MIYSQSEQNSDMTEKYKEESKNIPKIASPEKTSDSVMNIFQTLLYAYLRICRLMQFYINEITHCMHSSEMLLFSQSFVPEIFPYPSVKKYFLVLQASVYSLFFLTKKEIIIE